MFSVTEVDLEKNSKVNHLWVVPLAGFADWRSRCEGAAGDVLEGGGVGGQVFAGWKAGVVCGDG